MSFFLSSTAIIMKSNTIPLPVINSVWLYCDNPRHSVFFVRTSVDGFVWWASSYLLSWSYNHDHLIFLCHLQFSFANLVKYTRLFLLLFKYCSTLPVHAHKDKLKLCNVSFCVGHQGLCCSVKAPSNWAVFGWLKVGSVSLREKPVRLADRAELVFVYSVLTDNWGGT